MTPYTPAKVRSPWAQRARFMLQWIAGCATAELIGLGSIAGGLYLGFTLFGEPDHALWVLWMTALGAIEGFALGGAQHAMLVRAFPGVPWSAWTGRTMFIAMSGWALGTASSLGAQEAQMTEPSTLLLLGGAAAAGAMAGAVLGLAQWSVLCHYAKGSGWWVLANAGGWALGMPILFLAGSLEIETPMALGLAGGFAALCAGAALALPTGVLLVHPTTPMTSKVQPYTPPTPPQTPLRVGVWGAQGRTGQEVCDELHRQGQEVLTLPREPGPQSRSCDVVISVVGPTQPSGRVAADTARLLESLNPGTRLVVVSGAMVGHPKAHCRGIYAWSERWLPQSIRETLADRRRQEEWVRQSSAVWTVVRPPRLTDGPQTRLLRAGECTPIGTQDSISRGDLARFLVSASQTRGTTAR